MERSGRTDACAPVKRFSGLTVERRSIRLVNFCDLDIFNVGQLYFPGCGHQTDDGSN
jgi:hypothetical protein